MRSLNFLVGTSVVRGRLALRASRHDESARPHDWPRHCDVCGAHGAHREFDATTLGEAVARGLAAAATTLVVPGSPRSDSSSGGKSNRGRPGP